MKLWTAKWCGPCNTLKAWMDRSGFVIPLLDIETDSPSDNVKSVPTLELENGQYIFGLTAIKRYIEAAMRED